MIDNTSYKNRKTGQIVRITKVTEELVRIEYLKNGYQSWISVEEFLKNFKSI